MSVVVVSKATWKEEQLIRENIEKKVYEAEIDDGLILVGEFIDNQYD